MLQPGDTMTACWSRKWQRLVYLPYWSLSIKHWVVACLAVVIVLMGLARVNTKSRNLSIPRELLESGFYFIVFLCAKVRNFKLIVKIISILRMVKHGKNHYEIIY